MSPGFVQVQQPPQRQAIKTTRSASLLEKISILERLPIDIILHLVQYLCTSAAVVFALTCHRARELVGKGVFESIKQRPEELRLLRSVLAHDYSGWDYCPACAALHPKFGSEGPGPQDKTLENQWLQRRFPDGKVPHDANCVRFQDQYVLTWRHLHLVTKRHRYGPTHGIPLQNLCVANVPVFAPSLQTQAVQAFEAILVDGSLQLQRQISFRVPQARPSQVTGPVPDHTPRCGCVDASYLHPVDRPGTLPLALCNHLYARVERLCAPADPPGLHSMRSGHEIFLQLHERICCVLAHAPDQTAQTCEACRQASKCCPLCDMTYEVERENKGRNVLRITARYDFGKGETPDDPMWVRHRMGVRFGDVWRVSRQAKSPDRKQMSTEGDAAAVPTAMASVPLKE